MVRAKISLTPIVLTVIGLFGLTLISCAASNHETSQKGATLKVQEAAPVEPLLSRHPPVSESREASGEPAARKIPEKGGQEQLQHPLNNPPIAKVDDTPIHQQKVSPPLPPAGASSMIPPASRPAKSDTTIKSNAPKNPLKLNARMTHDRREEETERDIMEEALLLLDESQKYWVNGELEDALQMLDQAYSLLLDTNGKPDIVRQKDDLRLIISKRILAIYNSLPSVAKGKRGEIPIITNPEVEKEIRLFQTSERDFFISSYQRSMVYRPVMVRELKKAGLPEELSWLPLVESGYKINALSSARALGLWQFIPSTGYKYGLNRDDWSDERMDVEKSTRAAIDYFKDLHAMFGDWLTVLAGYNCGEGRVMRTIASQHINYLDRFWDLYLRLPNETARYVPRFLATLLIVRDPQKYGIDLGSGPPKVDISSYEMVEINRCMRLQDIAQKLDVSEETLYILNAELRHRMTPDRPYKLKVPTDKAALLAQVLSDIPQMDRPRASSLAARGAIIKHKVRQGETLDSIAQKYRSSAAEIRSINHLSKKRLVVGQKLNVPLRSARTAIPAEKEAKADNTVRYKVQKGDTLGSLSRKHAISVAEIRKINGLKSDNLRIGQMLRFSAGSEEESSDNQKKQADSRTKKSAVATEKTPASGKNPQSAARKKYTVKQGDSLNRIARENNIPLEKLLTLNQLTTDELIHPGQEILIQ